LGVPNHKETIFSDTSTAYYAALNDRICTPQRQKYLV